MLTLLLLSLLTVSFVTSQPLTSESFEHEAFLDFDRNFKISWNFNNTHIVIEMRANASGWIGVGFSANGDMRGADIHVGWVKEGRAYITDRYGLESSNQFPPLDTEQNLELIRGSECNGQTVIVFMRQLARCQTSQDRAITRDTMRVIYAYTQVDPTGDDISFVNYHGLLNRGVQSLFMFEDQVSRSVDEEDVYDFDVVFNGSLVPIESTYYQCQILELPRLDSKHHIIKMEPILNDTYRANLHHLIVFECPEGGVLPEHVGRTVECYRNKLSSVRQCGTSVIAAWAVGAGAITLPDHFGLPIGEGGRSRYVKLEIHYDNPNLIEIRDNSGMRFIYTSNLRQYDGGILDIGHITSGSSLVVPPRTKFFEIEGGCGSACLGGAMKLGGVESINVTNLFLHSHLAGRKMKFRHFRNGIELPFIAKDDSYDFNFQRGITISPEITVKKGDSLMASCTYTSMGINRPVVGGLSTEQEMCLSYFFYYPRIPLIACVSAAGNVSGILQDILGINSVENINVEKTLLERGFEDQIVTSPIKMANQSVADVMSSFDWNEEATNELEQRFKANYRIEACIGPQPHVKVTGLRAPLPIIQKYEESPMPMCRSPSSGFPIVKNATTCHVSK